MHLQELGVDLEQEDDASGFLVVNLDNENKTLFLETKQTRFIQRVIEAVILGNGTMKVKFKPSEKRPLVKDAGIEPPSGMLIYSSVVGMILYLSGHTIPDTAFTVNCFV